MTDPSATPPAERMIDLDVIRAVALIGVCVMNYHGYLIARGGNMDTHTFVGRVFNPWDGPLSTRFAATFVTVAGMSVTLLTRRSAASGEPAAISDDRWKLIRRGVLLLWFGYFLDWKWGGTILFFYGAYFVVAAFLFTLRTRWLVAIGAAAASSAAAIRWWATQHDASWLLNGESENTRSLRDLLFDVAVRGTHPLLPWLTFLCIGMVLGRHLPLPATWQVQMAFIGVVAVGAGYVLRDTLPWTAVLRSTSPDSRSLVYMLTTIGSTLVAIVVVGSLARATRTSPLTRALAVAGRTTLSLYVLHVFAFYLMVDWLAWVQPAGVGTSLLFALGYWVVAILLANLWSRWRPLGPLEWVYRRFSD